MDYYYYISLKTKNHESKSLFDYLVGNAKHLTCLFVCLGRNADPRVSFFLSFQFLTSFSRGAVQHRDRVIFRSKVFSTTGVLHLFSPSSSSVFPGLLQCGDRIIFPPDVKLCKTGYIVGRMNGEHAPRFQIIENITRQCSTLFRTPFLTR